MKELLLDIAIPSFQIFDEGIRFSVLFILAEHLFAFADFDAVQLPVCATDTPDFLSMCESFLVIDALIMSSLDKLLALEVLVDSAIKEAKRLNSVARFGALNRTRGRGVSLLTPARRNSWSRVSSLQLPAGTPKKVRKVRPDAADHAG
ncbi:hypothetical protein HDU89_007153 [Geranomyces variabilis]|nr:hypothetical protein HDU89_007153 [Geranomyces variabilis]